jgi:hypothetical protein
MTVKERQADSERARAGEGRSSRVVHNVYIEKLSSRIRIRARIYIYIYIFIYLFIYVCVCVRVRVCIINFIPPLSLRYIIFI